MIILVAVFVLVGIAVYGLLQAYGWGFIRFLNRYYDKLSHDLSSLNRTISKNQFHMLISATVGVCVLFGVWLPQNVGGVDQYLVQRGQQLIGAGQYREAVKLLSQVPQRSSPLAHNELGYAYYALNNPELAIRNFEIAAQVEPEYSTAHLNLATLYAEDGRFDEASFAQRRATQNGNAELTESDLVGDLSSRNGPLIYLFFCGVFAYAGFMLSFWLVRYLVRRRRKLFDEALPDAMSAVANSMRGGLSLGQAIEQAIPQAAEPVKYEFKQVQQSVNLGMTTVDALIKMADKVDTEDAQLLASNCALLTTTGGDLSRSMDLLAKTMRDRKSIRQKIDTMTAEPRVQAIALAILPVAIAWFMNEFQPEIFSVMYTTRIGLICSVSMVMWGVIGFYFMWKTVQIKV